MLWNFREHPADLLLQAARSGETFTAGVIGRMRPPKSAIGHASC